MSEKLGFFDYAWFAFSVLLLFVWLRRTHWGRNAFAGAPLREYSLTVQDVLTVTMVYLAGLLAHGAILAGVNDPSWSRLDLAFLVLAAGQIALILVAGAIATRRFAASWRGFVLGPGSPRPLLLVSLLYFVAAFGLSLLTFALFVQLCRWVGYEQLQKHPVLEMLARKPTLRTLALLFIPPAFITPVAEEFFFRGILQNFLLKTFSRRFPIAPAASNHPAAVLPPPPIPDRCRWAAIAVTALIFALLHGQWQHWPALWVLALCLGYAYERYGSLLVPIVMHALFNIVPLITTICAPPPQ